MLPLFLPVFATTDGAVNVAIVQGINDNLTQTRDANGDLDRHPATFTGIDGGGRLVLTSRGIDSQVLSVRARTQAYVGLDGPTSRGPTGTLAAGYLAGFSTGPRSSLSLSLTANLTSITSARAGDGNFLLTLDPTATGTSVASYSGSTSYSYTLAPRWTFTETLGARVTTTLSAPPLQAANGVVLDRTGLDGVLPSATSSLSHELGKRDVLLLLASYRYTYSPYSLDIATTPPTLGGPQGMHQVVPTVGVAHAISETVTATTTAGLSVSTRPTFDERTGPALFPVGSQGLSVLGRRWTVGALASVRYGSVTARLSAGPSYTFIGTIAGTPIEGRAYRSLYLVGHVLANHSSVPAAGGGSTGIDALAVGAELRYGLTRWLGLYTGYDVRVTSSQANEPLFVRQILFAGVSGYFTTDGNIPPIETVQSPYTP